MRKGLILSLLLFLPVTLYIIFSLGVPKAMPVMIYGSRQPILVKAKNGREKTDTLYHQIALFKALDENGRSVESSTLKGDLYIAAFIEKDSIASLFGELVNDLKLNAHKWTQARFVFFQRDDSTHAAIAHSTLKKDFPWTNTQTLFLSDSLFDAFRAKQYFVATPGIAKDPWTSTSNFILIDRIGRIRGYYNVCSATELKRLKEDLKHVFFHDKAGETLDQQKVEQRRQGSKK